MVEAWLVGAGVAGVMVVAVVVLGLAGNYGDKGDGGMMIETLDGPVTITESPDDQILHGRPRCARGPS